MKHFNVFPVELDKHNLFYEQKVFLIYLSAIIPSMDNWTTQVSFLTKKDEIKRLQVGDIRLSEEDINLAKLHGKDISEIKKERLSSEKPKRLKELNEEFGIEEPEKKEMTKSQDESENTREELWDMLQGKGLIGEKQDG